MLTEQMDLYLAKMRIVYLRSHSYYQSGGFFCQRYP